MENGMKLVCAPSITDFFEKIEITNGIEKAVGYDIYNKRKYKADAVKPKNNWRKLTPSEQFVLRKHEANCDRNNTIALLKLPPDIIEKIQAIGFPDIGSYEDYSDILVNRSNQLEDLMAAIGQFMFEVVEDGYSLSDSNLLCISFESPSIETIAYDPASKDYFGLHFDSSEGSNLFERKHNPNRLSINLGSEARYLLFLNIEMDKMFDMIAEKDDGVHALKDTLKDYELVSLFFEKFPDYPVLRLKQEPYEAYIAPTDNVVHDGSTLGKNMPDTTMVFIGYFKTVF